MKLLITIYPDEDGVFIAECPSIPGCVSQGKTEEEAEENIRDAIKECLQVRAENGLPLTVTTREVEVVS
ncbi:MAG: type II toxin-antitoxin system HicB family antitoxin [Terriglobia bacterium]|jgi:predicted RNase H-like HicB family nuclease